MHKYSFVDFFFFFKWFHFSLDCYLVLNKKRCRLAMPSDNAKNTFSISFIFSHRGRLALFIHKKWMLLFP